MEPIPGFVTVPRQSGSPRPGGAFFSAVVVSRTGPSSWLAIAAGRPIPITSSLALVPGQTLRLQWIESRGEQWICRVLPAAGSPVSLQPPEVLQTPLMAAFLSRGLPLAAEKLTAWTRWLSGGPSDRPEWAASLESRAIGPGDSLAQQLEPWLEWQAALEEGRSPPPPQDEDCWDLWNTRKPAGGGPWLVVPLHWTFEGLEDSGLLQAHWNPPSQTIDRWVLTAAPAGTPFRLEALVRPGTLDLTWRFFRSSDRDLWASRAADFADGLSSEGLRVRLEVAGPGPVHAAVPRRSIDVQA